MKNYCLQTEHMRGHWMHI